MNKSMRECILSINKNKCLHLLQVRGLPIPVIGICRRCKIVTLKEKDERIKDVDDG